MQTTKVKLLCTLALISSANLFFANKTSVYPEGFKPKEAQGISFTENKGQVHDQNYKPRPDVLFGAMAGNMAFHLKTTGVSYQLTRVDSYKEVEDPKTKQTRKEIDQQTIYRIDLSWLNANKNFVTTTDKTLEGYNNYYTEGCPEGGALNVKSYTGVTLHNLYTGINLHYYEKAGQLKHDYIVAPGANYKQIQLMVDGATVNVNKDGSLTLNTPLGKVQEGAPIVYQNSKQLKAKWVIKTDGERSRTISFEIENYNPNQELIIDPVTRAWGTYYGGNLIDRGLSCVTDLVGNVYLSGFAASNTGTVIATSGGHQSVHGADGGGSDAFLVQFNSSGIRQWATYYGGTGGEVGNSCATDATGNVYLAGTTSSTSGIATLGAHQTVKNSADDAFLVQFNSSGIRQWGTYYGGSGGEAGYSCTIDATGNVYMAGYTASYSELGTAGAHQAVLGTASFGAGDAFLVKFNSSGVRQWGTYYGGNGSDEGYSCTTDATGNVYLAGETTSSVGTVIATAGAHQPLYGGGANDDAFLVKFNSNGVRQWGTYYGGSGTDVGWSCAIDIAGKVYLTGHTNSTTALVIATVMAHQTVFGGGGFDAFLVQFDSNGVRQWGTYYGGAGNDYGYSSSTDGIGNVYIAGTTDSGSGIATVGSYKSAQGSGEEAFLVKFNSSGGRQAGTYYGDNQHDSGSSCTIDTAGNIYLSGWADFTAGTTISSAGAHQTVNGGVADAFLVKFAGCSGSPTQPISISGAIAICQSSANTYSIAPVAGASSYIWSLPGGWSGTSTTNSINTTASSTSGNITVTANNACGNSSPQTLAITINANPTITVNSGAICSSNNFTINPSGANTYTIQGGNTVVNPTANASYTVIGTSTAGCVSSSFATSNVTVNATPTINVNSGAICSGNSFTITPSGASTYTIQGGNAVVNPTATTNYTVVGTSTAGCVSSSFATSNVTVNATPTINVNSGSICSGNSFTIVPSGANTYTIQGGNAVVNPTATTNYTVVGTSTAGCVSSSFATSNVTVNPNPTVTVASNMSLTCVGESASLTASGANTYTWNTSSTSTVIVISPTITTTYTVNGTDANGCQNSSTITQSVSLCTGLSEVNLSVSYLLIYPNPFSDIITIETKSFNKTIVIYSVLGENIKSIQLDNEKTKIDLSELSSGIYFIKTEFKTIKIIKQ